MNIANTTDFSGGLNALTDSAKLSPGQYALMVNGRTRGNTVQPTYKHRSIKLPVQGPIQAVFAQGSTLFVFIAGIAYSANLTDGREEILLRPIGNWSPMSSTAEQIYVETVPATWNVLQRVAANAQDVTTTFNGSVASFRECLVVQDGINLPRAIFPNNTWTTLGSYNTWTVDAPLYVPIGKQMAYSGGKLYVVAPDGLSIYQSVSGRPTDFVVVIDNEGNKLSDVTGSSIGFSYAPATFIKGAETGSVIVATFYSTYLLVPDANQLFWGEPFVVPVEQFPVGFLNQQCYADISGDTAFLTQSGVQSFNVTRQLRIASNNQPIGAPISRILETPQSITAAAINFDDYALFGLNTIYGPLTAVYDTMVGHYVSLDNSFGTVKYFARILTENTQQLVFATSTDQLYLAYGDRTATNVCSVYLGDFVARDNQGVASGNYMKATGVQLSFVDVRTSGEVAIQVYADHQLQYSATQRLEADPTVDTNTVQPFPYSPRKTVKPVNFQFDPVVHGWKLGVYVSWNCDASLSESSLQGDMSAQRNPSLSGDNLSVTSDIFAAVGNLTLGLDLADGGSDPAGRPFATVKGEWYLFDPVDTTTTVIDNGKLYRKRTLFKSDGIALVYGDNIKTFSFRNVDTVKRLVDQAALDGATTLVSLGNLGAGTTRDIDDLLYVISTSKLTLQATLGNLDSANRAYFIAKAGRNFPYTQTYQYTDWYFYNSNDNYLGYTPDSLQNKVMTQYFASSPKRFRFVALHSSPYTGATGFSPGNVNVRLDFADSSVDGIFSASANVAEYILNNNTNYFTNGLGGGVSDTFVPGAISEFGTNAPEAAYYLITVNNLTANVSLKSLEGDTIGTKVIYG